MIRKVIKVPITDKEIESPEDIEIVVKVFHENDESDGCDYTIHYPKKGQNVT